MYLKQREREREREKERIQLCTSLYILNLDNVSGAIIFIIHKKILHEKILFCF